MSPVHLAAMQKNVWKIITLIKKRPSSLKLSYLWPAYVHLYLYQNCSLGYVVLFFTAPYSSLMHLSELNKLNF